MAGKQQKARQRRNSLVKNALKRGVVPVRRTIAPESYYEVIKSAQDNIMRAAKDLTGEPSQLNMYRNEALAVTLIGMSRFSDMMLARGPKTRKVLEQVPSCHEAMEVKIGGLAIFGIDRNPKIGFRVHNSDLEVEIENIKNAYERRCANRKGDYSFLPQPGGIVPHCTIGRAYEQVATTFEPGSPELELYDEVAAAKDKVIILQPLIPSESG